MNPPVRAPLGAALALLMALAALAGAPGPGIGAALVAVLVLMIAAGWPELLELPSAGGTRAVVATTGMAGAILAIAAPERPGTMAGVAMVCALGVFASFVHQMLRSERSELTASLTGTVAGVLLVGMASCWVPAMLTPAPGGGHGAVAAISLGLATALVVLPLPAPELVRAGIATVLAAAVTGAVLASAGGSLPAGLLAGLVLGAGTAASHLLLASTLVAREPLPSLAVAAAPVATAGVVALLAARLLG